NMNILILNWRDPKNPKSGGAEIVTLEHAKAWVKKGHSVTWFTSNFKGGKNQEIINNINIVRRGNFLTVFAFAPLFYLFSKNEFDVVVDEIHGLPFFTPLFVRQPKIAFIHEVADEIWDFMYPFPLNKIGKVIEPIVLLPYRNTKFMTVSDSTKTALIKIGIKVNKISVINNGIKERPLNYLPKKENVPTFIFVSRVVKMKGIEEVIRAFFYILREIKDARLWIVGDGEKKYVEELKETMRSFSISTKVKFFGRVDDDKKSELMKKAHLLLHASIKEGWGLVVIEAASQGTPAVVYDVAGLRDSVKNEKTGIVLKENNAKEMAREAINLIRNKKEYQSFQKNGILWAKSLTWERAAKQSLDLLNEVLNGN
nr:glycosyltransferase family 4 protein [Candidatus Levybacteria bacterium]